MKTIEEIFEESKDMINTWSYTEGEYKVTVTGTKYRSILASRIISNLYDVAPKDWRDDGAVIADTHWVTVLALYKMGPDVWVTIVTE